LWRSAQHLQCTRILTMIDLVIEITFTQLKEATESSTSFVSRYFIERRLKSTLLQTKLLPVVITFYPFKGAWPQIQWIFFYSLQCIINIFLIIQQMPMSYGQLKKRYFIM
jgi:hypothetical protein